MKAFVLVAALSPWGVSGGFVDMDTPLDKRTTKSLVDNTEYHLIMSDEFNTPNRTFADGHDTVWTALDKPDDDSSAAGGGSQQFYNSSSVTTTDDGMLKIATTIHKTKWRRYDPGHTTTPVCFSLGKSFASPVASSRLMLFCLEIPTLVVCGLLFGCWGT